MSHKITGICWCDDCVYERVVRRKQIVAKTNEPVMSDTIFLDDIPMFPPIEQSSVRGFIKHVRCHGARFHVIYYDTIGSHCSEKNCVLNSRNSHKRQTVIIGNGA